MSRQAGGVHSEMPPLVIRALEVQVSLILFLVILEIHSC